jgi:hypothetical protein
MNCIIFQRKNKLISLLKTYDADTIRFWSAAAEANLGLILDIQIKDVKCKEFSIKTLEYSEVCVIV